MQPGEVVVADRQARRLHQLAGLRRRQGEVVLAHLEHVARPQPSQTHGHGLPPGEHQVHDWGQVLQQQIDDLDGGRGEQMDVVEHEHDVVGDGLGDLVAEVVNLVAGRARQAQPRAEPRHPPGEGRGQVPQQRPVVEALVARAPDPRPVQAVKREAQQGRLAVAGPGDHRHQAVVHVLDDAAHQLGAGHQRGGQAGRQQAALQDSVHGDAPRPVARRASITPAAAGRALRWGRRAADGLRPGTGAG